MIVPKEAIQRLEPYIVPEEGRGEFLRLDFNENLWGASPKVLEAIGKIPREEYGRYPEYRDLNRALSQFVGAPQDCILATNGGDEAIRTVFDAYVDKGDEVILLIPSYSMYQFYAQIAGAEIAWVPYAPDFSFPIDEVLKKIGPNTRLIALANPNNPTGTGIRREDLIRIILANSNMVVLLDEAYAPYAKATHVDLATLYPNVFVTQTFSKAHGLAGLRIGCLVSRPENMGAVSKILLPSYSVDCIAAKAAIAAMEDRGYVEAYVDEVIAAREEFVREMEALGIETAASCANFVLVLFGAHSSKVLSALAEQRILVRQRDDLPECLRITMGTRREMRRVLKILKSLFAKPALIFDMDGVLVDESASYRSCIAKTAEYFLGSPVDPSLIQTLKLQGGYNNDYDCTERVIAEYGGSANRAEIIERFDAHYRDLKGLETWSVDGVLLNRLKEKFRLGIFTGRPRRDALDALNRFGKESFFEVVITDDDVQERKPSPEGLLLAMERLGVDQAVYVGDSPDDAEAARRARVEFIEAKIQTISQIGDALCKRGE